MLTRITGIVSDVVKQPVKGMRMLATDPVTHLRVSTIATTDANGQYTIKLSRKLSSTTVILTATPTATAPAGTPALQLPVDTSPFPLNSLITADLPTPALPAPMSFTFVVTGIGSSGAAQNVANATCDFRALVTDPNSSSGVSAVSEVTGTTNDMGRVTVVLTPAPKGGSRTYQLSISPPADSDFQSSTRGVQVGENGGSGSPPQMLPLRPRVTGRVVDTQGVPIANITFQPVPENLNALANPAASSLTAVTGADGRFGLRVDAGNSSFSLVPDSSLRLPRRFIEHTQVTNDLDLLDLRLPQAALTNVIVLAPDGTLLPDALVNLYSLSPDNRNCTSATDKACLAPPRLQAQGLTDSQGSAPVLLPVALPPSTDAGVR
jgi:hypothetical protein